MIHRHALHEFVGDFFCVRRAEYENKYNSAIGTVDEQHLIVWYEKKDW
jgi:hypothetical protein